jgi:hypothetical protein
MAKTNIMANIKKVVPSLIFGMFFLAINLLPFAAKAELCIAGDINFGNINFGGSVGDCNNASYGSGGGGGILDQLGDTGLPDGSIMGILTSAMFWLMGIFGIMGIVGFLISGIQYLTSAGDEDMIKTAKRNMTWSIVGVVVGLSGYVIVKAIIALLGGQSSNF